MAHSLFNTGASMAEPQVRWRPWPSHLSLFPDALPQVLPPPANEHSFRAPFGIDADLYNAALHPAIPITFATLYVITVFWLNAYNRRRNNEPWAIAKGQWKKEFGWFVVVHNVLLALYSFATFAAMARAIAHTLPPWDADLWGVRTADALCKLHGPRGFGDATTFNTTINIWESKNTNIHLTPAGLPDTTDVGRLWNEGLAFWGWMFYVSKFYEVLDTFIVLAKGKRSGTLQTYHHAGAMLCMWAGIRYMSPPIWMFVFVNSGIHAMMYTYFTLSALGVNVPPALKRTLTTLQIAQFVWGASYAAAHLFVQYDIPISTPFQIVHNLQRAASTASASARSATSIISSGVENPALPSATAVAAFFKKLLLRAAGEEGVAERIGFHRQNSLLGQQQNPLFGSPSPSQQRLDEKMQHFVEQRFETQYRTDWSRINCIDTTGEAFAIYLNLIYLSPLTWLFMRFFSRAYNQRAKPRSASDALHQAALSAREAKRETEKSIERAGERAEDEVEKRASEADEELRKDVEKMKQKYKEQGGSDAIEENISSAANTVQESVKSANESVKNTVQGTSGQDVEKQAKDVAETVKGKAQEASETAKGKAQEAAKTAKGKAQDGVEAAKGKAQEGAETAKGKAQEGAETAKDKAQDAAETAKGKAQEGAETTKGKTQDASSTLQRQGSGTWLRAGGGLFRRSTNDGEGSKAGQQGESSGDQAAESQAESAEQQDENLVATQETRPDPEEDTDAMGKSGVGVPATADKGDAAPDFMK